MIDHLYVTDGVSIPYYEAAYLDGLWWYNYYYIDNTYPYYYRYQPDLVSALAKAEEICAPYKNCEIDIALFAVNPGHYMLRSPDSTLYQKTMKDSWSGSMMIRIVALSCAIELYDPN